MVTLEDLKAQIELHAEGTLALEDLAAWAENVFRDEDFEPEHEDLISEILGTIRDAVDPHRFRWEAPDFEEMWNQIEDLTN